jgi:hypothetical protein
VLSRRQFWGLVALTLMGAMAAVLLSPRTPRTAPVEEAR